MAKKAFPKVRPIIIGNWKMNGLKASAKEIRALDKAAKKAGRLGCDMMICPPATLISTLVEAAKGSKVAIGSQDCHAKASGAHTGDISAEMVKNEILEWQKEGIELTSYSCGPVHMLNTDEKCLLEIGWNKEKIHYEKFW